MIRLVFVWAATLVIALSSVGCDTSEFASQCAPAEVATPDAVYSTTVSAGIDAVAGQAYLTEAAPDLKVKLHTCQYARGVRVTMTTREPMPPEPRFEIVVDAPDGKRGTDAGNGWTEIPFDVFGGELDVAIRLTSKDMVFSGDFKVEVIR